MVHRIICPCNITPTFRSGLGEYFYSPKLAWTKSTYRFHFPDWINNLVQRDKKGRLEPFSFRNYPLGNR